MQWFGKTHAEKDHVLNFERHIEVYAVLRARASCETAFLARNTSVIYTNRDSDSG